MAQNIRKLRTPRRNLVGQVAASPSNEEKKDGKVYDSTIPLESQGVNGTRGPFYSHAWNGQGIIDLSLLPVEIGDLAKRVDVHVSATALWLRTLSDAANDTKHGASPEEITSKKRHNVLGEWKTCDREVAVSNELEPINPSDKTAFQGTVESLAAAISRLSLRELFELAAALPMKRWKEFRAARRQAEAQLKLKRALRRRFASKPRKNRFLVYGHHQSHLRISGLIGCG